MGHGLFGEPGGGVGRCFRLELGVACSAEFAAENLVGPGRAAGLRLAPLDHSIVDVFVHVFPPWRGRENQKPGRAVEWSADCGAPQDVD
jgi:hypothetical protein